MNRINWTWIIDPTHQILISSLQVERVRHKSVSPHASLGELRCLPSTPSSVDMCFSRTFLAAEGNFSSAEQSPDLWYPGGCKPVTDTYLAVRDEKTTNQPKLNQGMIVYVPLLPSESFSHPHPDGGTLLWRKDLSPSTEQWTIQGQLLMAWPQGIMN